MEELPDVVDTLDDTLDAYGELLVDPGWITDDVNCKVLPATEITLDDSDGWDCCTEDDDGPKA